MASRHVSWGYIDAGRRCPTHSSQTEDIATADVCGNDSTDQLDHTVGDTRDTPDWLYHQHYATRATIGLARLTKMALGFQLPYWTLPPGGLTLPPVAASVMSKMVVMSAKITTAVDKTFLVANRAARGAIKIAPVV
jgi:hypothetical protein